MVSTAVGKGGPELDDDTEFPSAGAVDQTGGILAVDAICGERHSIRERWLRLDVKNVCSCTFLKTAIHEKHAENGRDSKTDAVVGF